MLAVAADLVLRAAPASPLAFLASCALMALFFQQSGWLSHDFCHNQVFKNRTLNHCFGMLTGNVFQVHAESADHPTTVANVIHAASDLASDWR